MKSSNKVPKKKFDALLHALEEQIMKVEVDCYYCDGVGYHDYVSLNGQRKSRVECPECSGKGAIFKPKLNNMTTATPYKDEEADINEEVEDEYSDDEFFGVDMGYDLPSIPTDNHLYCDCPLPNRREASKRPWITNADGSTEYYEFCDECKKEIKE